MSDQTKSICLYGRPNAAKREYLCALQAGYTEAINRFIRELLGQPVLFGDILRNSSVSSAMRAYEKQHRVSKLGSALSQTAFDEAVEKLSQMFLSVRTIMYGYVDRGSLEFDFVNSLALLGVAVSGGDRSAAVAVMDKLLSARNIPADRRSFYTGLRGRLLKAEEPVVNGTVSHIRALFDICLQDVKVPHVKNAWVRMDSRACALEPAADIEADYVLSAPSGEKGRRVLIPLSTSAHSRTRMKQYKPAKTMSYSVRADGIISVRVAVTKDVLSKTGNTYIGSDIGVTDAIFASDGKAYGSFSALGTMYDKEVLPALAKENHLRDCMRKRQKQLRSETDPVQKEFLRKKIAHLNTMLQQSDALGRSLRRYSTEGDKAIAQTVHDYVSDRKADHAVTVLEDIDIREFNKCRALNRRNSMWLRGQMTRRLEEALDWNGLAYVEVDPAYTSQICPACYNLDSDNRGKNGNRKGFTCTFCGHHDDADHIGSINIRDRAKDHDLLALIASEPHNKDRRHSLIRGYFATKHARWQQEHTDSVS